MNTLRSKAFVSIAIVFCLFLAYFATQPLPSERLHSYLDKVHSGAEKDQNSSSSSPLEHESVQYEIIAPSSSTATFRYASPMWANLGTTLTREYPVLRSTQAQVQALVLRLQPSTMQTLPRSIRYLWSHQHVRPMSIGYFRTCLSK